MLSNDTFGSYVQPPPVSQPNFQVLQCINNARQSETSQSQSQPLSQEHHQHIWIITGPAGSGKSTVAQYLATELGLPYIEGDDYHPPSNKVKMAAGNPLTDADRWDWLISLRDAAVSALTTPAPPQNTIKQIYPSGVVVTCSALKRKYRDVIRVAAYEHPDIRIHFVYLHADEQVLLKRVMARTGHYMKSGMVHSQFESLEPPTQDEVKKDVVVVECGTGSLAEVERDALDKVREVMAEPGNEC
ncbi:MAG: hypothetical protein M1834_005755 [Cirrosporium novae-zelandiae]|nr:MAG: hypothetical protein M1834_005755 [Cirrosporium novae-zelandiae]